MILDLIEKLIDRCIQLAKHKQEVHRSWWSDFVEPAFAQFEAVHNNYLETFRAYRNRLNDENASLSQLIDRIREDNLFTENQRSKLKVLAQFCADPLLGEFVRSIYAYLTNPYDFVFEGTADLAKFRMADQRWRVTLLQTLEVINEEGLGRAKAGITALDAIVGQMQDLYGWVTEQYLELKKRLLA